MTTASTIRTRTAEGAGSALEVRMPCPHKVFSARMHTATPREFSPLGISYWDGLGRCGETVPHLLKQLKALCDAKRQGIFEYAVHDRFLRSFLGRKPARVRMTTRPLSGRRQPPASMT